MSLLKKKHIIPALSIFTFSAGIVCMVIPFLPFGWFLVFATILILMPYVNAFEKAFRWVAKRDRTGISHKAGKMVGRLYRWAGEHKHSAHILKVAKECSQQRKERKAERKARRQIRRKERRERRMHRRTARRERRTARRDRRRAKSRAYGNSESR